MQSRVFDLIEQTSDHILDLFDFFGIIWFIQVGESIHLVLILAGNIKSGDIVIFDETEIIDEDIDRLDELLDGQVLTSLLVIVQEAIADEEMQLCDQSAALRVFPLLLLGDHSSILVHSLGVFLIKHEEIA